jgi:hypothetical protein
MQKDKKSMEDKRLLAINIISSAKFGKERCECHCILKLLLHKICDQTLPFSIHPKTDDSLQTLLGHATGK